MAKKQQPSPLATWLQATLARKGWSQADLAEAAELSKGHVHALYHGTKGTDYRLSTITALAKGLGVTPRAVFEAAQPKA